MKTLFFLVKIFFLLALTGLLIAILSVGALYVYLEPKLPAVDTLREVRLQVPARIYTREGKLISEFGEMRRIPVQYHELPSQLIHAFLAAEDDRFFEHPGVDYQGLARAALHVLKTGSKGPGGSTITMQVARNFFLSSEKTYLRKINEIMLSLKIERDLSKEEILELYLNRIFLGHRAYGIGAAAQVYYGKTVGELDLAQMAMLAGLPKAPSTMNPVTNPSRSKERRGYVLRRMLEQGFITQDDYNAAIHTPLTAKIHALSADVSAPWFAEMVRSDVMNLSVTDRSPPIGEGLYTHGYEITTTLDAELQAAANLALRNALLDYDRRHGYRGPEAQLTLASPINYSQLDDHLAKLDAPGNLTPGIVTHIDTDQQIATVYLGKTQEARLTLENVSWARKHINVNVLGPAIKSIADVLKRGDQIRLEKLPDSEQWQLAQIPSVEGALIAIHPKTGEILALSGGFDFTLSKFNRVTQAKRQAGSALKPFIYSVALEQGYTAASVINDAPVVFDDPALENTWRPENYSGRFYGPTRLREALIHSRNLVSIRLLQALGIRQGIKGLTHFGFNPEDLPKDLSLALGSASITPLELTLAYSVFANGGYRVEPAFLSTIVDATTNTLLWKAPRTQLCDDACDSPSRPATLSSDDAPPKMAPRTLSPQVAYIMNSMMQDVIQRGTARRATSLGRSDIAGKTGTTNDVRDAWFAGYHPDLAVTAWIGFDQSESLGRSETGGRSALPMWVDFMKVALPRLPKTDPPPPPGIVSLRINRSTGIQTLPEDPEAMFEIFIDGVLPPPANQNSFDSGNGTHSLPPGTYTPPLNQEEEIF
jgi:penicillin-binding protein 1A